jgi:hypothetical protein
MLAYCYISDALGRVVNIVFIRFGQAAPPCWGVAGRLRTATQQKGRPEGRP